MFCRKASAGRIVLPVPLVLQVARGAAGAGVWGSLFVAGALLANLTPQPSIAVFPVAVGLAVIYGLIPDRERSPQVLGSLSLGLVAVGSGLLGEFGTLEICLILGAIVGAVSSGRTLSWPRWLPLSAVAVAAAIVVVANLVPLVLDGGGFGHDESAYALKARHWIEGTPETGWNLHRGIAMSGLGYLVLELEGAEGQLRLLGLASIVGLAAATWVLGTRVGGRLVGPLAAVAVVASPTLLRRSTEYLSDVPSAALLVACMVVVWREFAEREKPTFRLLWLLPFAWAAFYLRYQSSLSFALIALAVIALFRDELKSSWKPVLVTLGVGLMGLVPHFIFSTSETGSPIGILLFTAEVAGREFLGEGLVDYFLLMGWPLAAFVGPVAAVFFIWWLVEVRKVPSGRKRSMFLAIPAVGQVLILGVLSHGEARFIFFPLALTFVGGITGYLFVSRKWSPRTRTALSLGMALVLVGSLAMSSAYVRRAVSNRTLQTEPVVLAAETARELSGEDSCGVMTSYQPQITYYSACFTAPFRTHLEPAEALSRLEAEDRYLLMVEEGKRQPSGEDLDKLIAETVGDPVELEGARDSAVIYVVDDG